MASAPDHANERLARVTAWNIIVQYLQFKHCSIGFVHENKTVKSIKIFLINRNKDKKNALFVGKLY